MKKSLNLIYLVFLMFVSYQCFQGLVTFNSISYYVSFFSVVALFFCWCFWERFSMMPKFHLVWLFCFFAFYVTSGVEQMYFYFGSQIKFYLITAIVIFVFVLPFFIRFFINHQKANFAINRETGD